MVVVVGAAVAGGTYAIFNDTETSTGNLFVAGALDLTVDQTLASYNGEECGTCHLEIVSDDSTYVGINPAVELSFVHSAWTADLDGGHVAGMPNDGANDGSKWIWITDGPTLPTLDQDYTFDRSFVWNGTAASAVLYLATDNLYTSVKLNGNVIGSTADENNFTTATEDVFSGLEGYLVQGTNTLQVTVRNVGLSGSTATSNPAGLLFKLEIDGTCNSGYVYQNTPNQSTCMLWGETDLDNEYFFNFDDVKPGDWGRNVISLHVEDNDAFACLISDVIEDEDNDVTDPEVAVNDVVNPDGELDDELEFFLWEDNGDGAYQNTEQIIAGPGTNLDQIQTEMVAMSLTGGGPTVYLGVAWCAGDQTLSGNNILCDGSTMGDIAQTDSLLASISAYVEQQRNNPNFSCEDVVLGN